MRRISAGAGEWVEMGTAKKMLRISAAKLHHLCGRSQGARWVEGDGERCVALEPPTGAWLPIPPWGTATAQPSATTNPVLHHFAAVSCLSGGFCSLAAGFFSGPDMLQKQDSVVGSPRERVGHGCPLSLMLWKYCSSRPQGHWEGSCKDFLLRLIMIYNGTPSSPFSHLTELV